MGKTSKKPRLKDIASRANTTEATVSMVLNSRRYDQVSVKTRERIQKIAAEMGYVPNRMAQMLVQGRTDTILMLVTDLTSAFVNQYVALFSEIFEEKGYTLFPLASLSDTNREAKHIQFLSQQYFDGAICLEYDWHNQDCYADLDAKLPLVTRIWPESNFTCPFPHVVIDYEPGVTKLFEHFVQQDRKHIAMLITVPPTTQEIDQENPRVCLYRQVLEKFAYPQEHQAWYTIHLGPNLYKETYCQTKALMKDNPDIDVLLLHSSDLVLPVYQALIDLGIKIGTDVGVAAFDQYNQLEFLHPTITVVREPVEQIGQTMAGMLLDRLANKKLDPDAVRYDSELLIQQSTQR
ncbi:MAG: hypothetical protein CMJ19_01570 [Phycisphaeraceae bacterium]|nr:hypothetical protein [Phycisphaeraceae bacterium]